MGKPRPSIGRASSWRAISGHRPILRIAPQDLPSKTRIVVLFG